MSEPLIEARGLEHRYGEMRALRGVDLAVHRGEVVALVGTNAAGKTTLLRLLVSLLDVQTGELVRHVPTIGYCPQDLVIWPDLSVREQVRFMASMQGTKASDGLELCVELGLGDQLEQLAGTLSGGQKRKLSIALALLHRPAVLVLDEPEVGLDPPARLDLRATLRRLAADGVGVVLSSHALDEVERVADRVVVLDAGRVVSSGTPAELAGDGRLEDRFLP